MREDRRRGSNRRQACPGPQDCPHQALIRLCQPCGGGRVKGVIKDGKVKRPFGCGGTVQQGVKVWLAVQVSRDAGMIGHHSPPRSDWWSGQAGGRAG